MGLFDFIGDAFGAITAPFTAVIDAGTKLLGLPPVIGDALKVAVGAATGDFVTLIQGSTQLLKDLAASAAETEYAAPKDEAFGGTDGWAPSASLGATGGAEDLAAADATDTATASARVADVISTDKDPEETRALDTVSRNFDAMNRDHGLFGAFGDKVITEKELRETAEDPDAQVDLKRAARYILDHPDLMDRLSRSRDGDDSGIARSDIDLAREPDDGDAPAVSDVPDDGGIDGDPEEQRALGTLRQNFDAMNRDHGLFGAFGDKVITDKELRETAEDPEAAVDLKRAARYVLDTQSSSSSCPARRTGMTRASPGATSTSLATEQRSAGAPRRGAPERAQRGTTSSPHCRRSGAASISSTGGAEASFLPTRSSAGRSWSVRRATLTPRPRSSVRCATCSTTRPC